MTWQPGYSLLEGKYIIEQSLGKGGFGITYLARDRSGQQVTIKTLNDKVQNRSDFAKCQQDFLNEALRLAKCSHPHIVRVEELIQHESLWCIVMEYVDGVNLARLTQERGPLPEADALHYIRQIGDALQLVHQQGFLHRDIKPLNIIVRTDQAHAVLIDFGMARKFIPNLTQVHTEYVTRGFAPIEQYDRRSLRGAYTDVYGLAATLYALLTNQVPEASVLRDRSWNKYKEDSLIPPQQLNPQMSDRLNQAILTGMALEPEDRPQSIAEWLELLEHDASFPLAQIATSLTPQWRSAVGLDYTRLRELLAQGQWQAADEETSDLMLQIQDREQEGRLTEEDVRKFPCRDLRIIDRLWIEQSQGHFGFSLQNRIWRKVNKDYQEFGNQVGWCVGNSWLPYTKLTFTLTAPQGHLPSWGRRGRLWPLLGSRLRKCGL
ncbi:GUN4 domain-containing protein [Desertifilum sp. FACHB-1129]|uniref:Serine/threonine protein kinase n=1 Tax=Desertifilum tharense IPPAS B-1220 TaxID=1781255 RepID=A0A1E5QDW4_9CYAN|nr:MULTISPECIES: serine/threonine-protein kinase [Desertifilum]MDA0209038.1 serine/threonine-protein kinase [Cyanobacteria bacterium FC1]MBD2310520.1 GUN4 domain-containing protein [Desertifilum sp. FACHB-1129]MBD2321972.1 GUN4 domain-containing protein [Desertifilum sp. FACHB-866]MBD2332099.1 GUN4 domain-containing protein [Desertifilum sp. FACHB-868]OEJ72827.1 serine/threonine protein kinase [Desertifilum tharense IPPAS B-1220]